MGRRRMLIIVIVLLMIIVAMFFARPVFWSVAGCLDAAGEGQSLRDSFEEFPVHLKKYIIKFNNRIIPRRKIMDIITDESEDYEVRTMAIGVLPSDDESIGFLGEIFWEVDEVISYRVLKRLRTAGTPVAEDIADIILGDYEKYSPEKICAALTAKKEELLRNNSGRTGDELSDEKSNFKKICEDIKNNYDVINKIDRDSDDYKPAFDPVVIAVSSLADLEL